MTELTGEQFNEQYKELECYTLLNDEYFYF